jgi:hypothetical protein
MNDKDSEGVSLYVVLYCIGLLIVALDLYVWRP